MLRLVPHVEILVHMWFNPHMNSWNSYVKILISCGSEETLTKDECTTGCWHTHGIFMQLGGFERNS